VVEGQLDFHLCTSGFELWTDNLFWGPMVPNKGLYLGKLYYQTITLGVVSSFFDKSMLWSHICHKRRGNFSIKHFNSFLQTNSFFKTHYKRKCFFSHKKFSSHVWGKLVVWFITTHNMWCLLWHISHFYLFLTISNDTIQQLVIQSPRHPYYKHNGSSN